MSYRKTLSLILLQFCLSVSFTTLLLGQKVENNASVSRYEQNKIRVKLTPNAIGEFCKLHKNKSVKDNLQLGSNKIDILNECYQVRSLKRVFPYSPKYETRHIKHGLHLWYELEYIGSEIPEKVAEKFSEISDFQIAKPIRRKALPYETFKKYTPVLNTINNTTSNFSDPLLSQQWHYNNSGQTTGTVGADINLFDAWEISTGSSDVIVAIIDGGIDVDHSDLKDNLWVNEGEIPDNGIDDDNNGYIDDVYGYNFVYNNGDIEGTNHGTHVGGTVAATNNNGIGVGGVAGGDGSGNGARLMSCMTFSDIGGNGGFAQSFVYAADNGAVISQNSWGYTSPGVIDQEILDAIDYFIEEAGNYPGSPMQGGLVLFASGNDNGDNEYYPGYYEPIVAIGSTNHKDEKAWYSNYGSWVDISAPGGETSRTEEGVLSTLPNDTYGFYQGTSMACPHASGIAALVVSASNGDITNTRLREVLETSVDNIDGSIPDYIGKMGSGRMNAFLALNSLSDITLSTGTLVFEIEEGANRLDTTTLELSNTGINDIDFDFSNNGSEFSFNTTSGTIPSGDTVSIAIIFDGTNYSYGNYSPEIVLLVDREVTISTEIHIYQTPNLITDIDPFNMGSIYLGLTKTDYIEVFNDAYGALEITSISVSNAAFSIENQSITLPPYGNAFFEVTFSPTVSGEITGDIIFQTETSQYSIGIIGEGNIPLSITDSLSFTNLLEGHSIALSTTIINEGYGAFVIEDIQFSSEDISILNFDVENNTIDPLSSNILEIEYTGNTVGLINESITLVSSDSIIYEIPISGDIILNGSLTFDNPKELRILPETETSFLHTFSNNTNGVINFFFEDTYIYELLNNTLVKNDVSFIEGTVEPQKGEIDTRVGHPVLNGFGEDEYYLFIDSDEEYGPEFIWNDISEIGIPVYLGDDHGRRISNAQWNFKFYENEYDDISISSNGYLTFDHNEAGNIGNVQIPSTSGTNALIAALRTDLYPHSNSIHYLIDDQKLTVQYTDVRLYGSSSRRNTFQIVYHRNGEIFLYYKDIDCSSYSTGIENEDGTIGLQVAYNTDYLKDNFAIKIKPVNSNIVLPEETHFTLNAQEEIDINFLVNTQDLEFNTLIEGSLSIQTSSVFNPTYNFDVNIDLSSDLPYFNREISDLHLHVNDAVSLVLSEYVASTSDLEFEINYEENDSINVVLENGTLTLAATDLFVEDISFEIIATNEFGSDVQSFKASILMEAPHLIAEIDDRVIITNTYDTLNLSDYFVSSNEITYSYEYLNNQYFVSSLENDRLILNYHSETDNPSQLRILASTFHDGITYTESDTFNIEFIDNMPEIVSMIGAQSLSVGDTLKLFLPDYFSFSMEQESNEFTFSYATEGIEIWYNNDSLFITSETVLTTDNPIIVWARTNGHSVLQAFNVEFTNSLPTTDLIDIVASIDEEEVIIFNPYDHFIDLDGHELTFEINVQDTTIISQAVLTDSIFTFDIQKIGETTIEVIVSDTYSISYYTIDVIIEGIDRSIIQITDLDDLEIDINDYQNWNIDLSNYFSGVDLSFDVSVEDTEIVSVTSLSDFDFLFNLNKGGSTVVNINVTNSFGASLNASFTITVVGSLTTAIDDDYFTIELYPNPAQEFVFIELDNKGFENTEFVIFNTVGHRVESILESKTTKNGLMTYKINISEIPSGMYFIQLLINKQTTITPYKFIKN